MAMQPQRLSNRIKLLKRGTNLDFILFFCKIRDVTFEFCRKGGDGDARISCQNKNQKSPTAESDTFFFLYRLGSENVFKKFHVFALFVKRVLLCGF